MRSIALAALAAASGCVPADLGVIAGAPDRRPAEGSAPMATTAAAAADLERRVHAETNVARRVHGRPALDHRDDLAGVARAHSRDMARRDYFAHRSPEGLTPEHRAGAAGVACRVTSADGRTWRGVNENLFRTWIALHVEIIRQGDQVRRIGDDRTPTEMARHVIDGWLDSPGHRRALLDAEAGAHGIGVTVRPDSAVFVVQVIC